MVSSSKRGGASSPVDVVCSTRPSNSAHALGGVARRPRRVYEASFKLMVVHEALKLPAHNRIKPTCRAYPGVEPVQVRKWIRNLAALQMAQPTAKLVQKRMLPSPPDLTAYDDSSETESVESWTQHAEPSARRPRGHGGRAFHEHDDERSPLEAHGSESSLVLSPVSMHDEGETMRVARELLSLSALPFGGDARA